MVMTAVQLATKCGEAHIKVVEGLKFLVTGIQHDMPVVVNLGAGFASLAIAEARQTVLITIDPVDWALTREREIFENAKKPNPIQILAGTHNNDIPFESAAVDLVFVNASYTEEAVKADIEMWVKLLAPGGFIVFHDYDDEMTPGVKAAVDAIMPSVAGATVAYTNGTVIAYKVGETATPASAEQELPVAESATNPEIAS